MAVYTVDPDSDLITLWYLWGCSYYQYHSTISLSLDDKSREKKSTTEQRRHGKTVRRVNLLNYRNSSGEAATEPMVWIRQSNSLGDVWQTIRLSTIVVFLPIGFWCRFSSFSCVTHYEWRISMMLTRDEVHQGCSSWFTIFLPARTVSNLDSWCIYSVYKASVHCTFFGVTNGVKARALLQWRLAKLRTISSHGSPYI